jgi:hypothetical protein
MKTHKSIYFIIPLIIIVIIGFAYLFCGISVDDTSIDDSIPPMFV